MPVVGLLPGTLDKPLLAGGLLAAMALAVATLAVASLVRRDRAGHGPTSRRMCRALRLSRSECRLLGKVARGARAPGAGSLLVSRGHFDTAVGLFGARPDRARQLALIRRRVFDGGGAML
jgi:hypothetical protein